MRGLGALTVAVVMGLCLVAADTARAELATEQEARQACENWLAYTVSQEGEWAGSRNPRIVDVQELRANGELLGRCFFIEPNGFVLVPVLKELPPIKAYSETSSISVNATVGIPQLLRDVLSDRMRLYVERYGSLDAVQPSDEEVLFDPVNRREWDRLSVSVQQYREESARGTYEPRTQVGPFLTSTWHQSGPYNDYCPMGDGGRTVVGCVATAMAQLMKFWEWPPFGESSHTYYWYGDDSCGGSSPGFNISADFYDSYDWANMPDSCDGGCSPEQEAALAELSFEAGVGVEMDYGHCGSGASWSGVLYAMPTHFRYDPELEQKNRNQHSAESWFELIQDELNAGRPMLYGIFLHAIVCDGWRDDGGQNQYHMNYGWGGGSDAWYTIDNLYCPWEGCNPLAESLIRNIQPLYASNDTCPGALLVGDGTYTGSTLLGTAGGTASCGDSDSSRDLWYHYIAPAGGTLQIDTCESSYDTVLSVYPYCPGTTATELACDDNGCGEQSAVSLDVMPGNHYLIRVAGYDGAAGSYVLNIEGPIDEVPPSPTPMTFDVEPMAVSTSAITMTATAATDADSPPVKYYFDFVNVQMPGGHDSTWRTSPNYTDTGLLTNCLYAYNVRARDSVIPSGNETAPSATLSVATFIQTPQLAPVVVAEATTATLGTTEPFTNLTWGQSGVYFDCLTSGGDGGINEWVQEASGTAMDLTPDTEYTFRFKARNQDAVETDWSPTETRRTKAAVPSAPVLSNAT
ncbi:MAG: C10 family peptidase, partial [Phycisphaerales bacterium]